MPSVLFCSMLTGAVPAACLHSQVLDAFTSTFQFSGLSFEAGIRMFLESFKLPGEAQKVGNMWPMDIVSFLDAYAARMFATCLLQRAPVLSCLFVCYCW